MNTKERVFKIISEQLGTDKPLSEEMDFQIDLNASSEEKEEIFLSLEEEFSLEFKPEDRTSVSTVGDMINIVKDYLNDLEE